MIINKKIEDIHLSDENLYNQFIEAFKIKDYRTAINILNNNVQLNNKKLISEVINALNNNLTELQQKNDPTFKSNKIITSIIPPINLKDNEIWFKEVN